MEFNFSIEFRNFQEERKPSNRLAAIIIDSEQKFNRECVFKMKNYDYLKKFQKKFNAFCKIKPAVYFVLKHLWNTCFLLLSLGEIKNVRYLCYATIFSRTTIQ